MGTTKKHADRSLDSQKAKGARNPSDGQTKFIRKDLVSYYAALCSCSFPDGKNEYWYTTKQLPYVECSTGANVMLGSRMIAERC